MTIKMQLVNDLMCSFITISRCQHHTFHGKLFCLNITDVKVKGLTYCTGLRTKEHVCVQHLLEMDCELLTGAADNMVRGKRLEGRTVDVCPLNARVVERRSTM